MKIIKAGIPAFCLFIWICPVISLSQVPVIKWAHMYGGTRNDFLTVGQPLPGGGFILAGSSESQNGLVINNNGQFDFWIVKIDSEGEIIWTKCFGGSARENVSDIRLTSDHGYIVAGTTHSNDGFVSGNHGLSDIWVIKLDDTGELVWQKCLGGSNNDTTNSIRETEDHGYIVAGNTASNDGDISSGNHGGKDYWIVKLDSVGNILWDRCYGGSGHESASCIEITSGAEYVISGSSASTDGDVTGNHGGLDYWIINIDSTGNLIWQKSLGGTRNDNADYVITTCADNFLISGTTYSNNGNVTGNHGGADAWLVNLNDQGEINWSKCYGGDENEIRFTLQSLPDENILAIGTTLSDHSGDVTGGDYTGYPQEDYWIFAITENGTLQWQKRLGNEISYMTLYFEHGYFSVVDEEGNFLAIGTKKQVITLNVYGEVEGWIVKLGPASQESVYDVKQLIVDDIGDNHNGSDLQVSFLRPDSQHVVEEYRIMVREYDYYWQFNLDSALAVLPQDYTSVIPGDSMYTVGLSENSTTVSGSLIVNQVPYKIFILSMLKNGMTPFLSPPSDRIVLSTPCESVPEISAMDEKDFCNGKDIHLTFQKIPDESTVAEYRFMIVPTSAKGYFDQVLAELIPPGNYQAVAPQGTDADLWLDENTRDVYGVPVTCGVPYLTYILTMPDGLNADMSSLSCGNVLILETPGYLTAGQPEDYHVHYRDLAPDIELSTPVEGYQEYALDVNNDGTDDFIIYCQNWQSEMGPILRSQIKGLGSNVILKIQESQDWIEIPGPDDPIDLIRPCTTDGILSKLTYTTSWEENILGVWNDGKDHYAGLIFYADEDTLTGWIRLNVPDYSRVIIKDYAWKKYSRSVQSIFTYQWNGMTLHFFNHSLAANEIIWDFGDGNDSDQNNPSHTYSDEGEYMVSLTVSGLLGTDSSAQLVHVCLPPEAGFVYTINESAQVVFSNTSSNASSFFWDLGDGNVSFQQDLIYTYSAYGEYQVMLIASNNCGADTAWQIIQVTGFAEKPDERSVILFPNPARDVLTIIFNDQVYQKALLEILDSMGKQVLPAMEKEIHAGSRMDMNIAPLPEGMYFLKFILDDRVITRKMIIMR